jgi:hypothetical protein
MSYKKNEVVTVISVAGEYVGKFVKKDESTFVLSDPKMLVNGEGGMGFANGICVTGQEDPTSMTFYVGGIVFVTKTSSTVESAYHQAVSGLIVGEGVGAL